ncbi:MAG: FAD/NAD(P)-binding protein [Actinomycetota bacterium]|nr:FAD/NAD(P)-binding protein [Actinomycetota bacterium]
MGAAAWDVGRAVIDLAGLDGLAAAPGEVSHRTRALAGRSPHHGDDEGGRRRDHGGLSTGRPPIGPALSPVACRVVDRRSETTDAVTLSVDVADAGLAAARPGQFTLLYAYGIGETPISLSGIEPGRWQHTIRAVGPLTTALAATPTGTHVGVRGPFGHGWPLDRCRGRDLVVVAGGLGLAPLRPAIEAVLADRGAYRRVTLLVGARSPDALVFTTDLARWVAGHRIDVAVTFDRATNAWRSHLGPVSALVAAAVRDPDRTSALVCGPDPMMRAATGMLERRGVEPARISLSLERSMSCGEVASGGRGLGPLLVCRDGPVVTADAALTLLRPDTW